MQNINKNVLIGVGVLVIVLGYMFMNKGSTTNVYNDGWKNETSVATSTTTGTSKTTATKPKTTTTTTATTPVANSSRCNLVITYPKPGASVVFPLVVTGYINNTDKSGCVWYQDHLRAGDVLISYNLRNEGYKDGGVAVPIITDGSSQSTSTSNFSVSLNLATKPLGVNSGTPIKLTFTELKVAGNPNPTPDHFDLNVYAK